MQPIRTLIADDELVALRGLGRLVLQRPEIRLVGEARTGREAVELIRAERPELVLLDIQMPDLDGLACLREIAPEERPVAIFVTAHERYALDAFEVRAVDYLLKPFRDERLFAALERASEQVRLRRLAGEVDDPPAPATSPAAPAGGYLTRLLLRSGERMSFVEVSEIGWIGAADYYAELHIGKQTHLLRETLAELEERLDPRQFVRVHRSALVNLQHIREIQPMFNGQYVLILRCGARVPVSRRRRALLEGALGQRL